MEQTRLDQATELPMRSGQLCRRSVRMTWHLPGTSRRPCPSTLADPPTPGQCSHLSRVGTRLHSATGAVPLALPCRRLLAGTISLTSLTVQAGAKSLPKATLSSAEAPFSRAGPGAGVSEPLRSRFPTPRPSHVPVLGTAALQRLLHLLPKSYFHGHRPPTREGKLPRWRERDSSAKSRSCGGLKAAGQPALPAARFGSALIFQREPQRSL